MLTQPMSYPLAVGVKALLYQNQLAKARAPKTDVDDTAVEKANRAGAPDSGFKQLMQRQQK